MIENPYRNRHFILLGLSCVLSYALFITLNHEPNIGPPIKKKDVVQDTEKILAIPDIASEDIDEFYDFVERPLFYQDRRPPISEPVEEKPSRPARAWDNFSLQAIVLAPGDKMVLIKRRKAKEGSEIIRIGEQINGWRLDEINERSIKLIKGAEIKTLELEQNTSKPSRKVPKGQPKNGRSSDNHRP